MDAAIGRADEQHPVGDRGPGDDGAARAVAPQQLARARLEAVEIAVARTEKEQGVLINSIEDQDGRIVGSVAPYLRMQRQVDGTWVSKYSDSDLDMDNNLFTDGTDLILMVTTIVDELYVTKYFYRFARA